MLFAATLNSDSKMSTGAFFILRNRLAQFRYEPDHQRFWEERWSRRHITEFLESYKNGRLDEFEGLFTRYLPRDLPVLEAGCGVAQLVMALSARGYVAEGIDYASETISRVKASAPELNVRVGDVYNIDVPGETYGGYISIGVFEHNPEGPMTGLREVSRILHRRGVAFISVPYLNPERQSWMDHVPIAERDELPDGLRFYQYFFAREDFEARIQASGLKVIDVLPYSTYAGLTRDFDFGSKLHQRGFYHWRMQSWVAQLCTQMPLWARWRWAHMLMYVCGKDNDQ